MEIINKDDIDLKLDNYDFANFFNVYLDNNKQYFYNINKTVNFSDPSKMSPNIYSIYTIEDKDYWTIISYKLYGTIKLWWLICKINKINDPLNMPEPGTKIKVLNSEIIDRILIEINK